MKPPQIAILGAAVVAAAAAAFLVMGRTAPPPPPPPTVELPQSTVEILVAARDINLGSKVTDADFKWQEWPQGNLPPGAILKSESPNVAIEFAGLTIQTKLAASQPILREMLQKSGSYIANILPPGKRALAIPVDTQGLTTAGNFIQPNDKVDIIAREVSAEVGQGPGPDGQIGRARIVLRGIRVLAIGDIVPGQQSGKTISGVTATLELTPRQAEMVAEATRGGTVILALRPVDEEDTPEQPRKVFTIVRFGYPQIFPSK